MSLRRLDGMSLTRQMLRRLVREEIMRAVEEDRRAAAGRAADGPRGLEPTHALLLTGRAGFSDRLARAAGAAVRTGRVAWIAADADFMASDCGRRLPERLGVAAANMPPVVAPEVIAWDSRRWPTVRTLWALPASLSALGGLVSATLAGGGRALHGALARRWRVVLVGHPHRAEGTPALKPGDPLAVQERELLEAARRLGCDQATLEEIERAAESLGKSKGDPTVGASGHHFYTVEDIEGMARDGAKHLSLGPRDRITPLAEDRARELGIAVVRPT